MAHQVMVMQDGRIVEAGTVQAILEAPQHATTQGLVAASLAP
jgi:microcin C transport system ATP-binding protein